MLFRLLKRSISHTSIVALAGLALAGCVATQTLESDLASPQLAPSAKVRLDSDALAAIGPVFDAFAEEGKLPGGAILVAQHGRVLYRHNFGMADIAAAKPARDDTVYRIFSMTKPVIAVAVLQLAEQGKLDLSDPVMKFIPEFADLQVYDSNGAVVPARAMTVEQLLTHTSGFSYSFQPDSPVAPLYKDAGLHAGRWFHDPAIDGLGDMAHRLAQIPLNNQPGGPWHYGMSFDVAGLVVERASGKPLDEYLEQHLFAPLGMTHTGFSVEEGEQARLATLYSPSRAGGLQPLDQAEASPFLAPPPSFSGGGGLVSTIDDYFAFAQMLANGGELNGVRVLAQRGVANILSNHLAPGQQGQLAQLSGPGYSATGRGLGFGFGGAVVIDPVAAASTGSAGEYAWSGAASTSFMVDPQNGIVFVFMTQMLPARTVPTRQTLRKLVYDAVAK